jgi:hypothetical protein
MVSTNNLILLGGITALGYFFFKSKPVDASFQKDTFGSYGTPYTYTADVVTKPAGMITSAINSVIPITKSPTIIKSVTTKESSGGSTFTMNYDIVKTPSGETGISATKGAYTLVSDKFLAKMKSEGLA